MKSIILPLIERKAHDMMNKVHLYRKKEILTLKQRERLISDPQQKTTRERIKRAKLCLTVQRDATLLDQGEDVTAVLGLHKVA